MGVAARGESTRRCSVAQGRMPVSVVVLVLEVADHDPSLEQGVPVVAVEALLPQAMCVSTTYGAGDWGGTPHGAIIAGAVFGKIPFVLRGIELEAVGVTEAARAMILAAERGRVGERYLISEKMITNAETVRIAAEGAGVPPPTKSISLPLAWMLATVGSIRAKLRGTDEKLSLGSMRLMRAEAPVDSSKAKREFGWEPRPVDSPSAKRLSSGPACATQGGRVSRLSGE